jgi:RHS repeat-associated protein
VAWTAFNMPALIQQNSRQIALTYGPDRSRFKRVDQNETGTTTTYYVAGGGHEVVESGTTVTHKTYIGGAAVVLEVTSTPTSSTTLYLLHDHLGSTDAVTDASGNVQTRYSFDAWGARRNVTWAAFTGGMPASLWQTAKTTRGYTGHEELDEVGLVHMNGRVYDPQLGRFLSADPFVQDGTDLQAFNHYAYVRNNPLSLTDPSGFSFLGGIFNAIGKFFTGVFKAVENAVKAILKNSLIRAIIQIAACAFGGPIGCIAAAGGLTLGAGGTLDQALQAMAFSAISVAVWTGVGDFLKAAGAVMQSGFDVVRVLVHGVVQGALSVAQGGNFLNGFAIGAAGEGADVEMKAEGLYSVQGEEGVAMRTAIAGIAGGTASVLTGGKFANGAVSAAFAHLFNDEAHDIMQKIVDTALSKVGSDAWSDNVANGNFGVGDNKYNLFVYDVLTAAGASPGTPNGWFTAYPPTAGQWADPNYVIPGWQVLGAGVSPQPGDVVAQSITYGDATGHVMIVGPDNTYIGTSDSIIPYGTIRQIPATDDMSGGQSDVSHGPLMFRRWAP